MPEFSIAFEDVSRAEADRLAHELRRDYAREGGEPDRLTARRTDAAAQGSFDLVWQLATSVDWNAALDWGRTGIETAALVKALSELVIRHPCAIRIMTPKGEIRISKGEANWDQIKANLLDVLRDGTKP